MKIRKYQKAHLCKHIEWTGNVIVFVKSTCSIKTQTTTWVPKGVCRECEYFEQKESEGEK